MTTSSPALFRVDADPRIGAGHVMRCLALAQAWIAQGGQARFALATSVPALDSRIISVTGFAPLRVAGKPGSASDCAETLACANELACVSVVLDSYAFDGKFQAEMRRSGCRVLAIDDLGSVSHYTADLVLNQNAYASIDLYRNREPYTELLLGPEYALLRIEFAHWLEWQRTCKIQAANVLITMGGSDPQNVTETALRALCRLRVPGVRVKVVIGGANCHGKSVLEAAAEAAGEAAVEVEVQESVTDMAQLMAWADVAVSASGSTGWELAFMGVPSLLISLAPNQNPIGASLAERGIAEYLGEAASVDETAIAQKLEAMIKDYDLRCRMSQSGRALVDGRGAGRVVRALHTASGRQEAAAVAAAAAAAVRQVS